MKATIKTVATLAALVALTGCVPRVPVGYHIVTIEAQGIEYVDGEPIVRTYEMDVLVKD